MRGSNSENNIEEYSELVIGGRGKESSSSNTGSSTDESTKFIEEQEEHFKLTMECMALEMVVFEASKKNYEDNEHKKSNNSNVESNNKGTKVEKVYNVQKEESTEEEYAVGNMIKTKEN